MKNNYWLVLILLLGGCFSNDFDPGIEVDTNELKPHQLEIEELMEEKIGTNISPTVYWTTTLCPSALEEDITAVVWRQNCYHGLTFDCNHIYIAERETTASSALIHELGHCFLLQMGEDGDTTHMNTSWWNFISEIEEEAISYGW